MPLDRDVVIQPGAAQLPFRILVRRCGQRLERGLVQLFKQLTATGAEMPGCLAVQRRQQWADHRVQLVETEELSIAQDRQNPALSQKHCSLGLGFVPGFVGARRDNGRVVMRRQVRIGGRAG